MHSIFLNSRFNGDISNWDVSRVTYMSHMFGLTTAFNGDISTWNVARVTDMGMMFCSAESFRRSLCGAAWVNLKADKTDMFYDSPGSISKSPCTTATTTTGTNVDSVLPVC